MKILIFSDIHGDVRALERIVEQSADIYIDAGDLATFGRGLERCGEILEPLRDRLWVLPGNHETHEATEELCARYGFVDFHRKTRILESNGRKIHWAGLGYSNITPFNTPGEYSEEEIASALEAFNRLKPLYLVIHFPPAETKLDEYSVGKHAGSAALRVWTEKTQPDYLFCGHIHETAGMRDALAATQMINVGKRGYMIEI